MNTTNTISQASLSATFLAVAEEMGMSAEARTSAAAALDESFRRSKQHEKADKLLLPRPLRSAGNASTQAVVSLKPPPFSPEIAKSITAALSVLDSNSSARPEEIELCRLIKQSPECSELYFLRAMIRQDAGDDLLSILDYEKVLQLEPNNLLAKMARLSCLQRTRGALREGDIAEISEGHCELMRKPEYRFAVIYKQAAYGGPQTPSSAFEKQFAAIEKAAYRPGRDRCVSALLTVMLFQQWFWESDYDCLLRARKSARQMLELWPRDRLAVSVLCWLGEGAKYGNIPDLEFRRGGEYIYHKSHLGCEVIFDYPILMQIPEIKSVFEDLSRPT